MRRKIYVTASEMLTLREQGMSNHDIAKSLDVSLNTVLRYIGPQGGRMESLEAFRDTPAKKTETETVSAAVTPACDPKPVYERYDVGIVEVEMNHAERIVMITGECGEITLSYEDIPDLMTFLAWAMRSRMEVTADGQAEQVRE